jgi:glyoxylase-like metal-dependent hydrolase (beta-lactamase superfamily II)/8-oxo-dGTP pyrophosphatase MutT (NUDIX family)
VNPIPAAASVLLSGGPGSREVLVVRRAAARRFFGGFLAFPGGKVIPDDAGPGPPGARDLPGPDLGARWTAACRELFEETGVLLARRADGSFLPSNPDLERCRYDLVEGRSTFPELLARLGLAVCPDDFTLVGSLTTPAYAPLRFDTTFFVAHLPPGQRADVWPGELDAAWWATPEELLGQWNRGECLISPPALLMLKSVRGYPLAELTGRFAPHLAAHQSEALPTILFAPAVRMIPLRTPGLPPSTHTNAYLVGDCPAYLLDPGATDAAEQGRLWDLLDAWLQRGPEARAGREGRRLTAVVLTHHHPDHIGAAAACARRYGVPVWAHPLTARAVQGRIEVHQELSDGERLDLGEAPDGSGPWYLQAVHTPGHAPGHLAFYEAHYRLLFAGDMVSTLSSVIIAPPDGDLAVYLASLHRLRGLDCRLLLPCHGNPSARPTQTIDECLEHRRKREHMLLAALSSVPCTVDQLADELYKGLSPEVMRFARLQVLAGLRKLQAEGRVVLGDTGWQMMA